MERSIVEIAGTYLQASLDVLPYCRPQYKVAEVVAEYRNRYGVDLEGASPVARGQAMPKADSLETLIGLTCPIRQPS